ncbi:lachesin-like isoform X1 [Aphis craccivora]|uniref:Lachesin-like isoform X1 n=1 Tax=Aphis craccivora TaxID=307492 RepID=A0A6G0ZPK0_APHCR|nr:lachesin-like isoform X1 [Aphis craccivora]
MWLSVAECERTVAEQRRSFSRNTSPLNGYEPDFLFPLDNVTIAQGRDAIFTCVVNNIGGNRVSAPEGGFTSARVGISNYSS